MKKLLIASFVLVFASVFLTGCKEEDSTGILQPRYYEEKEGQTYTIENESLKCELVGDTTTFKLTKKDTNEVWYSNPIDIDKHGAQKGKFRDILSSTLLVQYTNKTDNKVDIDNFSKSIKNKNYNIKKVSDTELVVDYSVGDVEKIYICPPAATETRMNEFFSKMTDSLQKSLKRQYKVYDYKKLKDKERKDALILFPDLEKDPVYVLRENITDDYAKIVEDAFAEAGYTEEDYKKDKETFNITSSKETAVFNISVHYILDKNEFKVQVPMEKIEYRSKYPISEISILPYFGTGSTDDKGFILVPDGTGGIINFNNGKTGQQTYTSNMYGWDYGLFRDKVVDETKSYFPMFAINNNDKGVLCVSEEGSAHSIVRADISGKDNGYNYGRFAYNLLHGENINLSEKSDTTVRVFEKGLPQETIVQRYIFSEKADYVSLAKKYREYLMKKYPTLKKKEKSNVSMTLEMVGAVDNTEHILGYPVVRSQALTTYKQAKDMLETIIKDGVKPSDISAKYSGWYNTGVKPKTSAKVNLISRLGGKSDMKNLTTYAKEQGIDLFLEGYFSYVMKDKTFDGFSPNRDAAKYCSREIAELFDIYPVSYRPADFWEPPHYLVKPAYSKKSLEKYMEKIKDLGTENVAFADYGDKLGADYNPKDKTSREAAMNMEMESMKKLRESGSKIMIQEGNQYAALYSDIVTNLPINSSKINLIDETIPFYTIALHGLLDYTGSAVNLAPDYEENILKTAETGAGLYYVFMNAPTAVLQEGMYTQYYACNFAEWKDDAIALYNKFNNELGDIYNQYIVNHEKIEEGVYLTGYEDGKNVIVNYNYNDYNYKGTVIPKRSFITEGGGR